MQYFGQRYNSDLQKNDFHYFNIFRILKNQHLT